MNRACFVDGRIHPDVLNPPVGAGLLAMALYQATWFLGCTYPFFGDGGYWFRPYGGSLWRLRGPAQSNQTAAPLTSGPSTGQIKIKIKSQINSQSEAA